MAKSVGIALAAGIGLVALAASSKGRSKSARSRCVDDWATAIANEIDAETHPDALMVYAATFQGWGAEWAEAAACIQQRVSSGSSSSCAAAIREAVRRELASNDPQKFRDAATHARALGKNNLATCLDGIAEELST